MIFKFFIDGRLKESRLLNFSKLLLAWWDYPGAGDERGGGYATVGTDGFVKRHMEEGVAKISKHGTGTMKFFMRKERYQDVLVGLETIRTLNNPISNLVISMDDVFFRINATSKIKELLDIAESAYNHLEPLWGYADRQEGFVGGPSHTSTELEVDLVRSLPNGEVPYILWANFLSPTITDKIGRIKLDRLPTWRKKNLQDGGLLLIFAPDPWSFNLKKREEIRAILSGPSP